MRVAGAMLSWMCTGMIIGALMFPAALGEVKAAEQFLYQWTDDHGNAHITDSLGKVPAKYRSKVHTIEQGPESEQEAPSSEQMRRDEEDLDRLQQEEHIRKMQWQQRVLDAKQRLAEAEARYRSLEQQKKTLSEQYGGGVGMVTVQTPNGPVQVPSGSPGMPQEVLEDIKKIEKKMDQAIKDRDEARNELENVIPDEARRAGIPPGWLREVE